MILPAHGTLPTARELEVLQAVVVAGSYRDAAHELGLSVRTVSNTLANVRARLGAASTTQAYWIALSRGYVRPG